MNKDKLDKLMRILEIKNQQELVEAMKSVKSIEAQIATPEQIAFILKNDEDFIEMVKGDQGETPDEDDILPIVQSCVEACMPVKDVDYFDGEDAEDVDPTEVAKALLADKKFIKLVTPKVSDGYTPVKGKDYFTESEVKDIKSDIEKELSPQLENKIEKTIDQIVEERLANQAPDLSNYLRGDQVESLVRMAIANGGTSILSEGNKVGTYHNINFIGATVTNRAGRVDVEIGVTPANDQVKVSTVDTTRGYLNDKLSVTSPLEKAITNPGGNEVLNLSMRV